jgi:hypothetical protein
VTARRVAVLRVSTDLLVQALHLPEGTKLNRVCIDVDNPNDIVLFQVEHPDLEPVKPGTAFPEVSVEVTRTVFASRWLK